MDSVTQRPGGSSAASLREERARKAVAVVRSGEIDAFRELVELYQNKIMSLSLFLVRDATAAEDLAQEVFVRAYKYLDTFDERRCFYPWLSKIAYRLAQTRRAERTVETPTEITHIDERHDPMTILASKEEASYLWDAVSGLPERERVAVLLYYKDELGIGEVAQVMGVSGGTVKTLLFRSREHLQGALQRVGIRR